MELGDAHSGLVSIELEVELYVLQSDIEQSIFNCSLKIKRLLQSWVNTVPDTGGDSKGVKLP